MDVNKLLEYQSVDIELYKLEKELRECEEARRYNAIKVKLQSSRDTLDRIEKETEELYKQFAKLGETFTEQKNLVESMETYVKDLDDSSDLNEVDYYLKNIGKYDETMSNIEREMIKIRDRISEIKSVYTTEMKNTAQLTQMQRDAYKAFMDKRTEITSKAAPIRAQLDTMSVEPPKLFEYYKKLRDMKKVPMVVPYSEPNCSACGMEIKHEVGKRLNASGDVAECPNCGRIVYLK